jgi:putative hydrolase of the HAD superfamily
MKKIKAIGFDYAGVIGGSDVVGKSFTRSICEQLDMDVEEYRKIFFSMNHLINTGQKTPPEFWEILLKEVDKLDQLDAVLDIWDMFENRLLQVSERMIELVKTLKTNGYKVGLLSNATSDFGNTLRTKGVDLHFDVFMISGDVGLMKPNPELFRMFINELGVNADEFVFIDDAEKSLSTAGECGFHPILFRSYEGLIVELEELNINVNLHPKNKFSI